MSVTVATGNDTGLPNNTKIAADLIGTGTAPAAGEVVQYFKLDVGADGVSVPVVDAVPITGLQLDDIAIAVQTTANATGGGGEADWDEVTSITTLIALMKATALRLREVENLLSGGINTNAFVTNSSVAVTGAFYPVTQPVSAVALPLPAGASTEATLALIKAKTDNLDVLLSTRTKPADTQKVDGSAVTQPVSGPLTDTQLRATPVKMTQSTRTIVGAYRCGSGQIAGAASAQNLVSIENPTGSGKSVWVKRIEIQGPTVTVSLTLKFLYLVGRTTAIPSAGTTISSQKRGTVDATAVAVVRQGPTATAATGNLWSTAGEQLFTAVGAGNAIQNIGFGEQKEFDDILLAPGEGLLIRAEVNNTGYFHSVDISWEEGT